MENGSRYSMNYNYCFCNFYGWFIAMLVNFAYHVFPHVVEAVSKKLQKRKFYFL